MTNSDDLAVQRQRAADLRAAIGRVTGKPAVAEPQPAEPTADAPAPQPPSPRDFIEQQMRRLDQAGGKKPE